MIAKVTSISFREGAVETVTVEISDFVVPMPGPGATGTSPLADLAMIALQGDRRATQVNWSRVAMTVISEIWYVDSERLNGALSVEDARRLAGKKAKVVVVYSLKVRD